MSRYFSKEALLAKVPLMAKRKNRVWDKILNQFVDDMDDALDIVQGDVDEIVEGDAPEYDCDASVTVNMAVYIDGTNHVAPALAGAGGTPAIGVVIAKPTTTTAKVRGVGKCPGFTGLVAGEEYYLSMITPGLVVTPAPPVGPPTSFAQYIGRAATGEILDVDPNDTPITF